MPEQPTPKKEQNNLQPGSDKAAAADMELLAEGEKNNCYHKLVVSRDRLQALLSFVAYDERDVTAKDILDLIAAEGINYGIQLESLSQQIKDFSRNKRRFADFKIAEGEPPVNGKPGKINFRVSPSSEKARYRKKEDGSIDYQELNLITNVNAGQELAELIPPTTGIPGRNVFGEVIPAEPGEPYPIVVGMGVKNEKDGNLFISTTDGYLVFERSVIAISEVYHITGDIDYSVGNINFVGKVVVTGDVLDEFKVTGRKGIEIEGIVGASILESNGDIIIKGGVAGKNKARIISKKNVSAKYLNEVYVEAVEDVIIHREILNSTIKTLGVVRVEQGRIIGGETVARGGVIVGALGSDLGIHTLVTVGVDYLMQDRLASLETQMENADKTINRITETVGPIIADKAKLERLSAEKKQVIRTLIEQLKSLKVQRQELQAQKDSCRQESVRKTGKKINVAQKMHPGVIAMLGSCRLMVKDSTKGPFSLIEDIENEMVRIVPMSNL